MKNFYLFEKLVLAQKELIQVCKLYNHIPEVQQFAKQFRETVKKHKRSVTKLLLEKKYKEGIEVLNALISIFPSKTKLYIKRSICHQHLEDYQNAVKDLKTILEVGGSKNDEVKENLALLYCTMGRKFQQYVHLIDDIEFTFQGATTKFSNKSFYRIT